MFFHHDDVYALRVLECEETKAAGSTRGTISHDGTLRYLAELGKVVAKRF